MSTEIWASLIAVMVALSGLILALNARGKRGVITSREEQLNKRVTDLEATVRTLLQDYQRAQVRIRQLEKELAQAKARIVFLEAQLSKYERPDGDNDQRLLIALGRDRAMGVDLAALRGANIRISRLTNVTKASFKRTLDRYRRNGRPIRYVHLSVHGSTEVLDFSGDLVDGVWLSEQLAGVQVLVIMSCTSDAIGDLLSVVPYVVTMREEISHTDAWQFAQVFWSLVANGADVEQAFDATLDRVPPAVAEFADLHCRA